MQYPEKNNDLINLTVFRNINKNIFLGLIILFFSQTLIFANTDSTGIKKIDGKLFIIYKVDPGQGLYGLARRYKTTVPKILAANSGLGQNLSVGQIILIPYLFADKPERTKVEKSKSISPKSTAVTDQDKNVKKVGIPDNKDPIYHTVIKKETLTQIAENHKITIEQIKSWNKGDLGRMKQGDKIIVGFKEKKISKDPSLAKEIPKVKDQPEQKQGKRKKNDSKTKPKKEEKPETDNGPQKTITENGMGTWVDDGNMSDISLAMHKTAPTGTIIRLTNPMNGKVKYVKVVGQLPEDDENKSIIIKISKNTANDLGIIDKDFRVRLDYSIKETTGE